jgi:hypothetical protein
MDIDENRRSLEDALASVMEGDGVVYAGDGMKLLVKPTTVEVTRPKRKRRRSGRSRERAQAFVVPAERQPDEVVIPVALNEDDLAEVAEGLGLRAESQTETEPQHLMSVDQSSVEISDDDIEDILETIAESVERAELEDESLFDSGSQLSAPSTSLGTGLSSQPISDEIDDLDRAGIISEDFFRNFRVQPIPIRFAEHARSPFVVSLRGLALSAPTPRADESIPQRMVVKHDLPSSGEVPDLEILEQLASGLAVDEADQLRYANQFTPTTFDSSYADAYGPARSIRNRIDAGVDRVLGALKPMPKKTKRASGIGHRASEGRIGGQDVPRTRTIVRVPVGRTVIVMGALAFVAMLPANVVRIARSLEQKRADVTNAGANALGDLQSAASGNLSTSIDALRRASATFRAADESLSSTNALAVALANVIPQARTSYASARALLEVGTKASDAGRLLAKGLDAALSGKGQGIIDRLAILSAYADGALPLLDDASRALAGVDPSAIPENQRSKIDSVKSGLETGQLSVREFIGTAELLSRLLGRDAPRRFLIVFQNPDEIRPTGGFMGSYAELDVDRGEVKRLVIPGGGTYDLQGQLVKQIVPPEPLQLVANRWEFQDSNWSPDFPTAAAKMRQLWSASGGYTVDGVIAINATVVADLLEITGPIDVPELGKTLTSANATAEIEKSAEIEYDRAENKPKKILSLAGPQLLEKLKTLPPEDLVRALSVLSDAMVRKEIQIALTNPDEDALAQGFDWSGRLKSTQGDSFAVIEANIAGGKTDAVLHEDVSHAAAIGDDGSVTDTVTISRTHSGVKRAPLTGVRNVAYMRIYVPRGSTLISANGFATSPRALIEKPREDAVPDPDIAAAEGSSVRSKDQVDQWDEGDRTVFGGWSTVDPGETATLALAYRLPMTAFDIGSRLAPKGSSDAAASGHAAYSLLLTSQSGTPNRTITSKVLAPASWAVSWSADLGAEKGIPWDRDRVVSSLFNATRP